jgi:hypothetical protein
VCGLDFTISIIYITLLFFTLEKNQRLREEIKMSVKIENCVVCGEDTGILGVLCQGCYARGYRLCLRCKRGYKPPDSRTNICSSCEDDQEEKIAW